MKRNLGLILVLLLLRWQPTTASHVMGGEMTYECLGNGLFEFTVAFYRDCSGIVWNQTSVVVNGPTGSFTLNRLPGLEGFMDISQGCASENIFSCGTNPGTSTGPVGSISKMVYKGVTDLSSLGATPAAGYMFSVTAIPANARTAVNNVTGGASLGARLIMHPYVDQNTGRVLTPAQLCDRAPIFQENPLALHRLNALDTARLFNAAFDADLDSVTYTTDFPLTATLTPITYISAYSPLQPLPNVPAVVPAGQPLLHPRSGIMLFRPSLAGAFLHCVRVDSWRNGQRISSIFRDHSLYVIALSAGMPPPYNPNNNTSQRAPFLSLTPNSTGQSLNTFTYYAGDTINLKVNVSDYFPAMQSNGQMPVLNSLFDVTFKSVAISNTNSDTSGCLYPPCATLRALTDLPAPAPAVTPPLPLFAGNGLFSGYGYPANFDGGGRISWLPDCGNLPSNYQDEVRYQFIVNGIDKNCLIEGRDQLSFFITLLPRPTVTPANLTGLTQVNGLNRLDFITSFDTTSIDPVDAVNYADSSIAFQRGKSVQRRFASFYGYQIYKSMIRTGSYQLVANILDPYQTSWIDTTNVPGQFYYIATSSGCNSTASSSDTLSLCSMQVVTIQSPTGSMYCPNTGTLLQANSSLTGPVQWYKNGVAISGATAISYLVVDTGNYSVSILDGAGCFSFSHILKLEETPLPLEGEVICAVTVDSATGLNRVLWEKTADAGVAAYLILREFSVTGLYSPIALVPFNLAGNYLDSTSNPSSQPYNYKIQAQDICSRNSAASAAHRSVHLTTNVISNNRVALTWTPYIGSVFVDQIILRSLGNGPFSFIGARDSSTFNFIDEFAPSGVKTYMIWLPDLSPCRVDAGNVINRFYSNAVVVGGLGSPDLSKPAFQIFPNPSAGTVRITSKQLIEQLNIRDMQGRLVHSQAIQAESIELNLSVLEKGMYIVEVKDSDGQFFQRLVLQ